MFQQDDDGFSLVEVLIAMFLLAVLSLALLPLLISTMRLSVDNRETLVATSFAKDEMARLQSAYPSTPGSTDTSCTTLRALETAPPVTDPASGYTASIIVPIASCPAEYPASLPVIVAVFDGVTEMTRVTTRVRVGAG